MDALDNSSKGSLGRNVLNEKTIPEDLHHLDLDHTALFLDFDGTLVDFAPHPDGIVLDLAVKTALADLHTRLNGALAIVSGRDIDALDRHLAPLKLPLAGGHGATRRNAAGTITHVEADTSQIKDLTAKLELFAKDYTGLLVEAKRGSVALHFRQRDELAELCRTTMTTLTRDLNGISLLHGKAVIEAYPTGINKGAAIAAFIDEAPFAGRRAVFAGDDVTDEFGFQTVNGLGGLSIKVGTGDTCAKFRIPTIDEFHHWLIHHTQEED